MLWLMSTWNIMKYKRSVAVSGEICGSMKEPVFAGTCSLQELDARCARQLARFRHWAEVRRSFGLEQSDKKPSLEVILGGYTS